MKSLLSHNGEIVDLPLATVELTSPAFQNSQAVYTSVRTYGADPFRLGQHLERLQQSAQTLGFELSHSVDIIRQWVMDVIAAAEFSPQFIRITATPQEVFIHSRPLEIDDAIYQGVAVISTPMTREMVKAKVVGTPGTIRAYQQAQEQGAYEALLVSPQTEEITEGSRSNVLWVKNGQLYWCDEALSGITQGAVLEIAQEAGIPVQQGQLCYQDLSTVDELLLTQTSRGIVPVMTVDGVPIGDGQPGVITRRLTDGFRHLTQS